MTYHTREDQDAVFLTPTAASPTASVIWLHGLGADGHDFVPLVPQLRLPAALSVRFVFPHAPVRAVSLNQGLRMRAWYDIKDLSIGAIEDAVGIADSAARLDGYLRREREQGIPANRIVLAGFSQGGAIALHTGLRQSERLAGIMALSTYLPLADKLAIEASSANRAVPIFMAHGTADPMIPYARATASRDLLQRHGYALEWHEYRMQHAVCPQEIADIGAWLARALA